MSNKSKLKRKVVTNDNGQKDDLATNRESFMSEGNTINTRDPKNLVVQESSGTLFTSESLIIMFLTLLVITIVGLVARKYIFKPQDAEFRENRLTHAEDVRSRLGIKSWHVDDTEYDFLGKGTASRNEVKENEARHYPVTRKTTPYLRQKKPKPERQLDPELEENSSFFTVKKVIALSSCALLAGLAIYNYDYLFEKGKEGLDVTKGYAENLNEKYITPNYNEYIKPKYDGIIKPNLEYYTGRVSTSAGELGTSFVRFAGQIGPTLNRVIEDVVDSVTTTFGAG